MSLSLRHVWRTVSDGNCEHRVLALQVWRPYQPHFHERWMKPKGFWEDVEIVANEEGDLETRTVVDV